jgi:hypothetical protein
MRTCKRKSLLDRLFSKILLWAAGRFVESLPVIGPIFKVVSFVSEVALMSGSQPAYSTA